MANAKLYAADGAFKEEISLSEKLFEAEIRPGCVYLAVKQYLANQRQGTSKTKGRSEVAGSGAKPWKQKGTGRARAGSKQSPIWVRGGKAHGTTPRSYVSKLNKKIKRHALLSALSSKAVRNSVHVFESLAIETPKTSAVSALLSKAEIPAQKVLFLVSDADTNLFKSASNIPSVETMRVQDVNTYQLIRANNVIFSKAALEQYTGEA
jgi:large subunit ribosomal protein L4